MEDLSATGRLPDFIFNRRPDLELECDLVLAGLLVTDFPKERKLSRRDRRFILRIIDQLRLSMKDAPELTEAYIWRIEVKPTDGLSVSIDDRLLEERCRRCVCIMITSGTGSVVKVPSDLLRDGEADIVH